jgi:hypothetical protein
MLAAIAPHVDLPHRAEAFSRAKRGPRWRVLALTAALHAGACGGEEPDPAGSGPQSGATGGTLGGGSSLDAGSAPLTTADAAPAIAGDADGAAAEPAISGSVTYFKDIKPFVDAKCVRCHIDGTVAPFSLDSYDKAKQHAAFSRAAINAGKMPPWQFEDGCNEYRGNYSLSAQEKALFNAWVEQGAPAGDADKPAPKLDIGEVGLSRVDATLKLPEPYTSQQLPDEYRCFPVRWPERYTSTTYMTGFRAVPSNPRVVHHVEVYHVSPGEAQRALDKDAADPGPGYTCFGGPGLGNGTVGGWAPGSPGYDYPANIGIEIPAGSVMVIQVHYNTQNIGHAEADQTAVEFKVDSQAIAGGYDFWNNPRWTFRGMPISANDPDVAFNWISDPTSLNGGRPMLIYSASLHMHNLGTTGFMYVRRPDGSRQCVLKIDDWDFHWQGGVRLQQPIPMNPGDTIEMECRYDNSAQNQPVYQGQQQTPRDVNWGENTTDEMCLGILMWGPQQ